MNAMTFRQTTCHAAMTGSVWLAMALIGCETTGGRGGLASGPKQRPGERWTIRCFRAEGSDRQRVAMQLAQAMKQVKGISASKVQVADDGRTATLYYGRYAKVPSGDSGRLVFPDEYQQDIALIQRIMIGGQAVFRYARPVPAPDSAAKTPTTRGPWDISQAHGAYSLLIGVFYNTPTFDQRIEAAEAYVQLLRQDGFKAYYRHEAVKSFVFVGDFEASDLIRTPTGGVEHGPRVDAFIARRPEEFSYLLENGYKVKRGTYGDELVVPPSYLVKVPRD